MRAAGDDDEALAANVDDDVLVVPDHRIRLPAALSTGVVDREAPFEARRPLDLARDEDGPIDEDGWSLLLDDRQALRLEVGPARWWEAQLGHGREDDLALPPGAGLDDQREPATSQPVRDTYELGRVVSMAMRDDECPEVRGADPEDVEVPAEDCRREPAVVEEGPVIPVSGDGHERREAVLGDEFVAIAEVRGPIPLDAGCVGHEDVDEAVDDDLHLDRIDGHAGDWRSTSHRLET